ncbi:MAG: hypothetical protein CMJ81_15570 [Planctomycetaceae bacterium]|nr:hypothetical protein [Planctomycetaceae bacterium]
MLEALKYEGLEMPPGGKLPSGVIADFERWIRMGAPDPRKQIVVPRPRQSINYLKASKFWSFVPPQQTTPPTVNGQAAVHNAIDRFVLARLEAKGLRPVKRADRRTLIRRVSFGLIGLPPTPEEVADFVNDDRPESFARVVDRLLESKHFGERWARHWLDVARYGEDQAHTFKARRYPNGHRYRDWVVRALNDDMPFDQFVSNQIAADLVGDPSNRHARLAALGFFATGPVYYQDNGEKAKALADEWDDRIDTLSRGLLGMTLSCARCHDHKYDPFTMEDYYALAGIFSSSEYKERPAVSDEVVRAKHEADGQIKAHQLDIDRFLDRQSRQLRPSLVDRIPDYVVAAWTLRNRRQVNPGDEKLAENVANELQLSQELIERWESYLYDRDQAAGRSHLAKWFETLQTQDPAKDLSSDKAVRQLVHRQGQEIAALAAARLPRRQALFAQFGANVAFVRDEDRANVRTGDIPLGNLFDDHLGISLAGALSSDRFQAIAEASSLGVDRVAAGWGDVAQIATDIRFQFVQLGSDGGRAGRIANDGWDTGRGISTQGKKVVEKLQRTEQGIGMHANALVTFDLDEIRQAGLMSSDQKFVFKVDRAGINDDVFGGDVSSVYMVAIVSRPHSKPNVYDAILAGYVNGRRQKVEENNKEYYFAGELPAPLKADGRFVSFEIPVPAAAKFLTLATTGAGRPEDDSVQDDHSVFSGARLEVDPLPAPTLAKAADSGETPGRDAVASQEDRADAIFLSELLYDQGLLAIPAADAAGILPEAAGWDLRSLQDRLAELKEASGGIPFYEAHTLAETEGADLNVYRSGDPTNPGELAPRSFPAVLTGGQRRPFHPEGSGRLELARAITDPANPLTARVIVNRIWAGHFGWGLVRTPSNFGTLGERPTHPGLLDWLAVGLIENGWSLKWLHRTILLSATYQRSSDFSEANYVVDGDNHLLWRMNRRRLEIEPWRDAMLDVSGNLDRTLGGPSQGLDDADNRRRTLYGVISRHKLNKMLRLFDFPDPNITSARRMSTTVPLQQLFVINSGFMTRQAGALAVRLEKDVPAGGAERIERAYRLLFARPALPEEVAVGQEFLQTIDETVQEDSKLTAWSQYSLGLLGSNEFTYID